AVGTEGEAADARRVAGKLAQLRPTARGEETHDAVGAQRREMPPVRRKRQPVGLRPGLDEGAQVPELPRVDVPATARRVSEELGRAGQKEGHEDPGTPTSTERL